MAFFKTKFESHKQEWATPAALFDRLNEEFHFTYDLAADVTNTKCDMFFDAISDALKQRWLGVCWLNPPYGARSHRLSDWVKKAYLEANNNCGETTVVMLIPARTNTTWWHRYCMDAAEIRFLEGRPKFGDAKHGLPQPLALVIFHPHSGPTKLGSFKV